MLGLRPCLGPRKVAAADLLSICLDECPAVRSGGRAVHPEGEDQQSHGEADAAIGSRAPRRLRWIREPSASTYRCQRGAVAVMPLGKPRCGAVGVRGCEPQCEVQCEPQNEVQCEVLKRLWRPVSPVNVLSDNANGAAPVERPAPGSRGISS
jgi:hypothetical protein